MFQPLIGNGLSGRPRTLSLHISQVAHFVRANPGDWSDWGIIAIFPSLPPLPGGEIRKSQVTSWNFIRCP